MASRGYKVFPCRPGEKIPRWKSWRQQATLNPKQIEEIFGDAESNVGAVTDGRLIVDVDVHKGGEGWDRLNDLPRTLTIRTARGGLHYHFTLPVGVDVGCSVEKIGSGIDVRANGGLVLAPGSEVGGGAYTIADPSPIVDAPSWLIAMCDRPHVAKSDARVVGELDTPAAVESARAYLETSAPEAVEGSSGDNTTYKVACAVLDRGVSPETALDLMLEHWNERCSPPWDPDDLERKVQSAVNSRQAPIGRDNPALGFVPIEIPRPAPRRCLLKFARDISMDAIREQSTNATIKGLFGPKEIILTYGESTAAKTFAVADRCWHIALGMDWQGRKTKKRPVLYVCLEGERGFEKRMEALKRRYGDPGDYFAVLNVPVTLIRNPSVGSEGVKTILAAFNELLALTGETTGHIALDTLSRAIAGDNENSAEDMMHFIAHRVDPIRHETSASFEIIHHTNKVGDIRGSSSLKPAVDCMMRIDREGPLRTVTAEKVKDGEDGTVVQSFTLEQVCLGIDADSVPITSRIVQSCEPAATPSKPKAVKEGRGVKALRAAMVSATGKGLLKDVEDQETGECFRRLFTEDLRPEFYAVYRADSVGTKRRAFARVLEELPPGFKLKSIGGVEYVWHNEDAWS